ncbi:hypothetical protein UY3_10850 [Chelonia mydas]|uniref:Uncharacterized protein n=1 Tax=Chelonia mydas TaxID=8469 RepID=M7B4H6_CHEMY|nr:hypothetical protein UY3_10850 [Chelonia mydas]
MHGDRSTRDQFSGSSEDPLNRLPIALLLTPVLHRNKQHKTPYHGKHGACSAHRCCCERCKHLVQYVQNLQKQARWRWQCGDKCDEDMNTDFSQSTGPSSLDILVAMGQAHAVER